MFYFKATALSVFSSMIFVPQSLILAFLNTMSTSTLHNARGEAPASSRMLHGGYQMYAPASINSLIKRFLVLFLIPSKIICKKTMEAAKQV